MGAAEVAEEMTPAREKKSAPAMTAPAAGAAGEDAVDRIAEQIRATEVAHRAMTIAGTVVTSRAAMRTEAIVAMAIAATRVLATKIAEIAARVANVTRVAAMKTVARGGRAITANRRADARPPHAVFRVSMTTSAIRAASSDRDRARGAAATATPAAPRAVEPPPAAGVDAAEAAAMAATPAAAPVAAPVAPAAAAADQEGADPEAAEAAVPVAAGPAVAAAADAPAVAVAEAAADEAGNEP